MSNQKITPEKVTRPIQLLAAWLTGLIIIDGSFLTAAAQISTPAWAPGSLVIAAIINVPLFLVSIFLLQTKFRPEMQEDVYYSKYLEQRYTNEKKPIKEPNIELQIQKITKNILDELGPDIEKRREPIERILHTSQIEQLASRFGSSRSLSELYLREKHWPIVSEIWEEDHSFQKDIDALIEEGIVVMSGQDYKSCKLNEIGKQIAKYSEDKGLLYAQDESHKEFWEKEGCLTISSSRRSSPSARG